MIKQDCFAMKQDKPDCMVLDELYCKRGPYRFYKGGKCTKADMRD